MSETKEPAVRPFLHTYHEAIAKLLVVKDDKSIHIKWSTPQQLFQLLSKYTLQEIAQIHAEYSLHLLQVVEFISQTTHDEKYETTDDDRQPTNLARAIARGGHQMVMEFLTNPSSVNDLAQAIKRTPQIRTIFDALDNQGRLCIGQVDSLMQELMCEGITTALSDRLKWLQARGIQKERDEDEKGDKEEEEEEESDDSDEGDDEEDLADTAEEDEAEVAAIQLEEYEFDGKLFVRDEDDVKES